MSADQSEIVLGAIVKLTRDDEDGTVWEATQADLQHHTPIGKAPRRRVEIDWSFGPVKVTGYLDTDTFELGVTVSVVGIDLGTIYGNLKDGIVLKVNIFVAQGEIRFYLKNGNELWVHLSLKITFDGTFEGDYKIIGF